MRTLDTQSKNVGSSQFFVRTYPISMSLLRNFPFLAELMVQFTYTILIATSRVSHASIKSRHVLWFSIAERVVCDGLSLTFDRIFETDFRDVKSGMYQVRRYFYKSLKILHPNWQISVNLFVTLTWFISKIIRHWKLGI